MVDYRDLAVVLMLGLAAAGCRQTDEDKAAERMPPLPERKEFRSPIPFPESDGKDSGSWQPTR